MAVLAGYALIALAIFGAGFGAGFKYEHAQIELLNLQIRNSNEKAERQMGEAVARVTAAEQSAEIINVQLESANAKNLKLATDYSTSLASVRMRVPAKHSGCSNPVSKNPSTAVPADTTDYYELPEDLAGLLRSEALRADTATAYGQECYKFVSSNCGVKQ